MIKVEVIIDKYIKCPKRKRRYGMKIIFEKVPLKKCVECPKFHSFDFDGLEKEWVNCDIIKGK